MNKPTTVSLLAFLLCAASGGAIAHAGVEPGPAHTCHGEAVTILVGPEDGDVVGTPGKDVVRLSHAVSRSIRTLGGDDLICGKGGSLVVKAGTGADRIEMHQSTRRQATVGGEPNVLRGGEGDDVISGTLGDDRIDGGAGTDQVQFFSDEVRADLRSGTAAGSGRDRLRSLEWLQGTPGDDLLIGSAADNKLYGGHGADRLLGEGGRDTLLGGPDPDRMNGGGGRDYADGRGGPNVCRDVEVRVDCERR